MRYFMLSSLLAGLLAGCGPKMLDPDTAATEDLHTIQLAVFRGPDRVAAVEQWKQRTATQSGWDGLFVVHGENQSSLYWGKFKSRQNAEPYLKRAKAFEAPHGKPFEGAMIRLLPGKNVGPPEYNLSNTPPQYEYTVMVAVFYDVPEADYVGRRQFAVQYCRQLREEGHEAYYYHGVARSAVTIGLFGPDAVKETEKDGVIHTSINSDEIHRIRSRFPYLAENGQKKVVLVPNIFTRKPEYVEKQSYTIRIPREDKDGQFGP